MKILSTFLVFIIGIFQCSTKEPALTDQTVSVYGKVSSTEDVLLDSVYIGFFVEEDNINANIDTVYNGDFEIFHISEDGKYRIDWFLGPVPLPYNKMVAYKKGYQTWHYDQKTDEVVNLEKYLDSLNVVLKKE